MFILILLLCSSIFIAIGIFALRKKEPINFWANDPDYIKHEAIVDVKAYNRKCGMIWILFGFLFFLPILMRLYHPFPDWILGIFIIFISVVGMITMMIYYEYLHDVYTKKVNSDH